MLDVSRLCPRGTIRDILEATKSIDFLYNEFRNPALQGSSVFLLHVLRALL